MKPKAKSSFVDRFQQIMQELDAFKDHEARIKALEERLRVLERRAARLPRTYTDALVLTHTQADLDAAVKAERQRCARVARSICASQMGGHTRSVCQEISNAIEAGE